MGDNRSTALGMAVSPE